MAFLRFLIVSVILVGSVQVHGACEEQWAPFGDYCYRLFPPQPWAAAEGYCSHFDADSGHGGLASIHSIEENEFLQMMRESTVSSGTQVWVGGTSRYSAGYFRWTDKTPFDYADWLPGEPNSATENCISLWRNNGRLGWNDSICSNSYHFICKVPKN